MFGYLLLILFLVLILPKLVRGYLFVRRVRRQTRSIFDQMYGTPRQQTSATPRRKDGWSVPASHKRKIDPSVAEKIRFEEISNERTVIEDVSNDKTGYTVEQQVSDAEWEDL